MNIQMVDLRGQYRKIQKEIDEAIFNVIHNANFINGFEVENFQKALEKYTEIKHVIPCANGTDALQISLMASGLKPGDEVIVPAFTYIASAEVIGLLNLTPVMVDVDYESFNVTAKNIEKGLSDKTKAIIPVHLFGQSCDMEPIIDFAAQHNLFVIEDNAQAIGACYMYSDGSKKQTGTMGNIGCTSFFPSKNLSCFGDGGAMMTNDDELAKKLKMIANHGQATKYYHEILGCNSRLDTLQAAVLNVKLKYLNEYSTARYLAAQRYYNLLKDVEEIILPIEKTYSTHVYHQYTIKTQARNKLQTFLKEKGIPSMVYYPLPMYKQNAFKQICKQGEDLVVAEKLSQTVLSLPIHTELTEEEQVYITDQIKTFFA
ncbi:MAG: DegT/DnrJ/EryC1/StrS family aminotransferase [Prevotellaceae bacterium]|nr:DegT/DnrJ/EryC1/StrS family aminotransferase [Prevotellaceae bacterium]